jgi:hypothetical protein
MMYYLLHQILHSNENKYQHTLDCLLVEKLRKLGETEKELQIAKEVVAAYEEEEVELKAIEEERKRLAERKVAARAKRIQRIEAAKSQDQ